jgi:hypothetical protein
MKFPWVLLAMGGFLCAVAAVAPQETQPAPVSVSMRVDASGTAAKAVLELQNVADKPVAAYAVRLIRRGEDGKALSIRTHSAATRSLGLSVGRASFQPGEKWTDTIDLPEGGPVEVKLDLVLFEDGTHWGPNKSGQLERFLGMRDGARLEREAARK